MVAERATGWCVHLLIRQVSLNRLGVVRVHHSIAVVVLLVLRHTTTSLRVKLCVLLRLRVECASVPPLP